jgi:hypothetical protein
MTGCRKRWRRPKAASGLVLAVCLLCLAPPCPSASGAQRGCEGRIAFDSVREGNRDIYAITPPTADSPGGPSALLRLTTGAASDAKPSWSPPTTECGQHQSSNVVLFERTSETGTDIWRVDPAYPEGTPGTPAESLTTLLIADGAAPAWAPATPVLPPGLLEPPIAFERKTVNDNRDIFVANSDGSNQTNVTMTPNIDEANPDWASKWAQELHLAFDSNQGGGREIWVMDLRFEGLPGAYERLAMRQATGGVAGSSIGPSWYVFSSEADGTGPSVDSIAFAGPDQAGGSSHIHYVELLRLGFPFSWEPGVENEFTLTQGPTNDGAPAWSPDCHDDDDTPPATCRMAYERTAPGGDSEIYLMTPFTDDESLNDLDLTNFSGGDDRNPAWEADELVPIDLFKFPKARGRRSKPRGRAVTSSISPTIFPESIPGPLRRTCRRMGTPGNDLLCGTSKRDILRGKGGNDRILGRGGNDALLGGPGDDVLLGGPGKDWIAGEGGGDRINGGPGSDTVRGGRGRDVIRATDGQSDRVSGGPGGDQIKLDRRDTVPGAKRKSR